MSCAFRAACVAAALTTIFPHSGLSQNLAMWNAGSGNWSNASNWVCTENSGPSHPCVPAAGYDINTGTGDVTLDIDASVTRILGSSGSLLVAGHTLTATDPTGIFINGLIQATAGSVINAGSVTSDTLVLNGTTLNGAASAQAVTLGGSSLTSIAANGQIAATQSNLGTGGQLTLLSASSLTNSQFGGAVAIQGGSLLLDSNSTVSASQTLVTGGSLTIQGGSQYTMNGSAIFVGVGVVGASSVDVSGTGSVLTLNGAALELGQTGSAAVTIENGAAITSTGSGSNVFVGLGVGPFVTNSQMSVLTGATVSVNGVTIESNINGSTGAMLVSGTGSSVTAAHNLSLFNGGTLNVSDGGNFTADTLVVNTGSGITVDQGTLTINSTNDALVATQGSGTLTVQNSGSASIGGRLIIGGNNLASGTLSLLSDASLETAADGSGLSAVLGFLSGSNGTANVQDGASWQAGGALQIGLGGTGALNLAGGGTVTSDAATLGVSALSAGSATVANAGSKWTVNGTLTVGGSGQGTLTIQEGGLVTSVNGVIGENSSSASSTANVTGTGSKWQMSGNLSVGLNGTGALNLADGGKVGDINGILGVNAGSKGTAIINGGGSVWSNAGRLLVGAGGDGILTIDNGGVVTAGSVVIGGGDTASVLLTRGSGLAIQGDLEIAGSTDTSLTANLGSTITSGNGIIGGVDGAGVVEVSGDQTTWTVGDTDSITIGQDGELHVLDQAVVTAPIVMVNTGGLLEVRDGTIVGSVVNNGGTVTPGDATGTMTISGNYTQNAGTILFEIDGFGAGQFDRMVVSGIASFTGGVFDIVFGNGFVPTAGEQFDLISAAGGLNISGVSFDVIGLPSGMTFSDTFGPNGLELSFAGAATGAPEPASTALVLIAVAAMWGRRSMQSLGQVGSHRRQ
jgi:T5SS/PEP-CTERM-associated repeat protein